MSYFEVIDKIIYIKIPINMVANSLIYLAGLLWGIELIPQVIKTVKTKDVTGISFAFYCICLTAYIVYAIGNVLLENWNIVIAHIPSILLFFVMFILVLKYRKNNESKN